MDQSPYQPEPKSGTSDHTHPFNRPMRWAQLTLVDNDPQNYDLHFWLDYFKRTRSDAACLSAGGYTAYYPTTIPMHHRSAWMGDTDPFGDLVSGCRAMDMTVIARTDPHAVRDDIREAHPDWIAVDAAGHKKEHWAMPGAWVACPLGPYSFEFMTEVNREIMSMYDIDGIFSNRWAGSGTCYCANCKENFLAATGHDLPHTTDPQDPARKAYILWRQSRLFDLWRLWDAEIRKLNPHARFIGNSGGGSLSELDMKEISNLADTMVADRQGRSGLSAPWANGKNAKEFRGALGNKPIAGMFGVGVVSGQYRWIDSVQSEAEIRIWAADVIANGMHPWFIKFAGAIHDHRWLNTIEDIFSWHYEWERYLRNEKPLARVAIVYSQQTATFYGGVRAQQRAEDHILGAYQALIEARIPFEMVHDKMLDQERIDRFRTLVLPNIAALSDEQCDHIRQYVQRGGRIVATFETSLYNEWGVRRDDLGLADLFGVRSVGATVGPMKNSYLLLREDTQTGVRHPLLQGLDEASRTINGAHMVPVEAIADFSDPPLTLVPSYPDLPMEEAYPRLPRTDVAQVYTRDVDKGRVVYFPWDIDRTFWEILNPDHGSIFANAVKWATDEEQPAAVTGPGMLDVAVWQQADSVTVHLVNLTNPMMMRGPFRDLIPVGQQQVRVKLPQGRTATRVRLLRNGLSPRSGNSASHVEVTVPSILDYEIVAIDLSPEDGKGTVSTESKPSPDVD